MYSPGSLARRLLLALVIPVALLIAVGAILALQISHMSESAAWVDHTDEVLLTLHALEQRLSAQEAGVRGYQLNGDQAFAEAFRQADPQPLIQRLRGLVADNEAQTASTVELERRYRAWQVIALRTIEGDVKRSTPDAQAVAARRLLADEVHAVIARLTGREQALRDERAAELAATTRATKLAFVGLLTLTALALGFFSRRSLVDASRAFDATLAREREVRDAVQGEEWLRGGLIALSTSARGELTLAELGSRLLEALAPYVKADVGALFVASGPGYSRVAGFALDETSAGPTELAAGEGLVGRAARAAEIVHVRDVPPERLRLRSATIDASPAELVLFSAHHEDELLAVVELGFLRAPDERALRLIARARETIGSAIHAARQRMRLGELLQDAQRHGEELQAQQEELRVTNEELQEQSRALQEAQAQLEERQEELEASNAHLEQQTTELEQAQLELQAQAGELTRASQYKSEFLANMSHELRTPLNSSLILAKLLADNRNGTLSAEEVKFARTIYSAGNDLLTLINDILDLSKIEAGRLDVNVAPTTVARLIEPMLPTFKPLADEKGIELRVSLGPELPERFETDLQRAQQILKNLLSNALKFTERGSVELRAELRNAELELSVRDTGIGIPAHQQGVIFEAFRQADGTTNRKYGGTGLGLSISRDLARLLGGELRVQSEPGKGSVFTLQLPRSYSGPRAAQIELARSSHAEPLPAAPRSGSLAPSSRPPAMPSGPYVADDRDALDKSRRLLLVVEDDPAFAQILVDLAHELDFQCVVTPLAEEGLKLARELLPAAVLLDVNLPDRSGLSVLDRMKRTPATRHIPVHVVSVADYASQALSMGAMGYMLKPVQREQLIGALRRMEDRLTRRLQRVLIVEDDATQREAVCQLLTADDLETVAVGSVREALANLRTSSFDCVVTDLTLPGESGYDLLEMMAADEGRAHPPVIVYTGRSLTEADEQRLRRYSSAIIVKGARSPERLLDELTLFLHRVEAELPPERQRMLARARDRDRAFEGRTILVVEDDVRNIFALSSVLEPLGASVLIARNGRQGLEMLEQNPNVELILMDIMMPEMDGLEATREIRKRPGWRKLPIIALTAKAMQDDQQKCIQAGANDYIAKPLDVDTLLSLLRVWLPK